MTITCSNEGTKKRRVLDFLARGNTLTANQATSKFGVGNIRATMSDIKSTVEEYGNWEIYTDETATGLTKYGMEFLGCSQSNPFALRVGIS